MRQLRRVGDDAVVLVRVGERQPRKADVRKECLERLEHAHVGRFIRREDHRRAEKEVAAGVDEAAALASGHRVPADVGKAVPPGDGRKLGANAALNAAQVDHDRAFCYKGRVRAHPVDGGARADRHKDKIAPAQGLVRKPSVDRAGEPRERHRLLVEVDAPDGVRGARLDALCHRAADQSQSHDADVHASASCSRQNACSAMSFLASLPKAAGVSDCGPSHSACAGSLCTSIKSPSQPAATAPAESGATSA